MEAQRQSVTSFVNGRGELIEEFTEVESTRNQRPQLDAALSECQKKKATLLIARLDRLARNVAFISNLMESRVEFVAADMPEANRLTIHILAAVAEHERDMISKMTKVALAAAKARGVKLGNPNPVPASEKGVEVNKAKAVEFWEKVVPIIEALQGQGYTSLSAIANELNDRNILAARGGRWYPATVKNILVQKKGT